MERKPESRLGAIPGAVGFVVLCAAYMLCACMALFEKARAEGPLREVVVDGARLTNHLVIVLDVSGSMTQRSWAQWNWNRTASTTARDDTTPQKARAAVGWLRRAAESVGDDGEVQIVAFANGVWRSEWRRMPDGDWLNAAIWSAQQANIGTGTTAGIVAVVGALQQRSTEAISVLVISDMEWQDQDMATIIAAAKGRPQPAPIAVIGIDSGSTGPGDETARDMAKGTGGMYFRITTDPGQ